MDTAAVSVSTNSHAMIFFIAVISFRSWIYKKIITVQQPKHKSKNRLHWQKFTGQTVNRTHPQSLPVGNALLRCKSANLFRHLR
jgi:hypothetical protein